MADVSELADRLAFPRILGSSLALMDVLRRIRRVAPTATSVVLVGEPGTGKDLLARAIHQLSLRRDAPFVRLCCAANVETWPERLEVARHGTVFLDDIDAAPPEVQTLLLRFLDERSARIVAATQRDLRQEVAHGRLRGDLYFRLAGATVSVPPLRDRDGDIPLLAAHFVEVHRRPRHPRELTLSGDSLDLLRAYAWPGNVRELQNCIERALILVDGERIEPRHLALGPARMHVTRERLA